MYAKEPMSNYIEQSMQMTLAEYLPILQERILSSTSYMGIKTLKNPNDMWVYQEILHTHQPDVVIEIGTNWGGSTLAFAHLLDRKDRGRVIGIDIDQSKVEQVVRGHPRIELIEAEALSCFEEVASKISESDRVLIIEDSSHTFDHTLAVLRSYSTLCKVDDFIIVEDSICHHGLDVGPQPGPYEAIEAFLDENAQFESVRELESFLITWNPKGFLRRRKS